MAISGAAAAIRSGGLVVYPTDTLWGLGASAVHREAVRRVVAAKRRPSGAPISIAFSSAEEIEPFAILSPEARAIARRVLPGPVTLILRASPRARAELAAELIGPDGTVGIRVPDHPVPRELARQVGPITCTSANRHGDPPCRSLPEARRVFGREVAFYLRGSPPPSGRPSQLLDLRGGTMMAIERGASR